MYPQGGWTIGQGAGIRGYLQEPGVAHLRNWTWWWMASWAVRWAVDPIPLPVAGRTVREAGRIVNVSVVVATAVNGEGKREIIGMDVGTSEDGAFWLAFLRSLSARGLGRAGGIGRSSGTPRRHRRSLRRSQLATVPHPLHDQPAHSGPQARPPWVATMVRTIYQQP